MQDKDMDELFHSKLDGYEVEPSASVWTNINRELGANKRRRNFGSILRIAASVVIITGAGLFFWPKQQKIELPKNPKMVVVTKKDQAGHQQTIQQQPTAATTVNAIAQARQIVKSRAQIAIAKHPQAVSHIAAINSVKTQISAGTTTQVQQTQIAVVNNQQQVMATTQTPVIANKPIVPETPLVNKTTEPAQEANKPVLAAVNSNDTETKPVTKKHRIHGLGGLLNAMIGAVDKRQDKIIEFTDTDEGDDVTGINLGIIKVKKQ